MKTVVIGGGASGLIASYFASAKGNQVVLIEKNEKLGKKLYITGKGRCNVTNNVGVAEFLQNVNTNHKFLHSSINAFPPSSVIDFFENNGLKLKTERGNRVFPLSDKSSDVIKCLEKALINNNVDIRLNTTVISVNIDNDEVCGVTTDKGVIDCDNVIVCTGGVTDRLKKDCSRLEFKLKTEAENHAAAIRKKDVEIKQLNDYSQYLSDQAQDEAVHPSSHTG